MTKKKLKPLLLAAIAAFTMLTTGCVPTTETSIQRAPDFSVEENAKLDYVQLHNDALEAFGDINDNPYVFITNVEIGGDDGAKRITLHATAFDDATKEDAEQFAAAAVRHIADAASIQSGAYALSSQEDFGNLWDTYGLQLQIRPESVEEGNTEQYLLNLDIPAGGEIPLNADIETYEEEWMEQRDLMLSQQVYGADGMPVEQ